VPANDRFRPDNRNGAQDGGEEVIKPNEQKTIGIVQIWSLRHPPAEHVDLLPQDQIFRLQLCSRPKERSQGAKEQLEQISYQAASLPRPFPASTSNRIFGTHNCAAGDVRESAHNRARIRQQQRLPVWVIHVIFPAPACPLLLQ
jgi:hypothetical protein